MMVPVLTGLMKIEFTDKPKPMVLSREVLVKVECCGICGSDVHGYSNGMTVQLGTVMGHECSGVVVEVGEEVKSVQPDDRVWVKPLTQCGECYWCKKGQYTRCLNTFERVMGLTPRYDGAFAEYILIKHPDQMLFKLPPEVSFEEGALVEPLAVSLHAVRSSRFMLGDRVVVVGAGMIGLLLIQVLRTSGCGTIVAMDIDERKLQRARRMGADACFDPASPGCIREVMELTKGRGADMAFEAVGVSPAVASAVGSARAGGRVVLVGNVSPKVEIPLQAVVSRQIVVLGSCASQGEYPECLELIARRRVDVDSFVSARAPLSDGAAWFDRLHRQEPDLMKVILEP